MTTTCLPPIRPPAIRKRMRPRSPSEDEETLIHERTLALALAARAGKSAIFEQMVRDLSLSLPLTRLDLIQKYRSSETGPPPELPTQRS